MLGGRSARGARVLALVGMLATAACGGNAFSTATPMDGGVDGSTDGPQAPVDAGSYDAPPTPFCDEHLNVTLCEDFDGIASIGDLKTKWSAGQIGGGVLQLVGGLMSPHALQATAGDSDSAALLHVPFPPHANASMVRVEYDLRVDQQSVGSYDVASLTSLILGRDGTVAPAVYLYLGAGGALYLGWIEPTDGGRGVHSQPLGLTPPTGSWSGRWGVTVRQDGTVTATHNGASVGGGKLLTPLMLGGSPVTLQAGLSHNSANTGAVQVTIDNLVVDVK